MCPLSKLRSCFFVVFSIIKYFSLGSGCPTVPMAAALLPHHVKVSKGFNTASAQLNPRLALAHGLTRCFQPAADRRQLPGRSRGFDGACGLSPQIATAFKRDGTNQSLRLPSLALISHSIPFCRPNPTCVSELPSDLH